MSTAHLPRLSFVSKGTNVCAWDQPKDDNDDDDGDKDDDESDRRGNDGTEKNETNGCKVPHGG